MNEIEFANTLPRNESFHYRAARYRCTQAKNHEGMESCEFLFRELLPKRVIFLEIYTLNKTKGKQSFLLNLIPIVV